MKKSALLTVEMSEKRERVNVLLALAELSSEQRTELDATTAYLNLSLNFAPRLFPKPRWRATFNARSTAERIANSASWRNGPTWAQSCMRRLSTGQLTAPKPRFKLISKLALIKYLSKC